MHYPNDYTNRIQPHRQLLTMSIQLKRPAPPVLSIQNAKTPGKTRSHHNPSLSALLPAPEHLAHVHRRLLQHLVPNVGVDVRRGLVVRVNTWDGSKY